MSPQPSIAQLADDIRQIYLSGDRKPAAHIEAYLEATLRDQTAVERIEILEHLAGEFGEAVSEIPTNGDQSEETLTRLFSLVLGGKVRPEDLSSEELLERLACSLNTIFDSLNHLVKLINLTLH